MTYSWRIHRTIVNLATWIVDFYGINVDVPSRKQTWQWMQWNIHHEWRCVFYWTWGFSSQSRWWTQGCKSISQSQWFRLMVTFLGKKKGSSNGILCYDITVVKMLEQYPCSNGIPYPISTGEMCFVWFIPSKMEWDLPNGPRSVSCDRAIRYSGFFGVCSVGPVGDF